LLATKLHVPRPRPDLVSRQRLEERLDEGLGQGVVLVCAPAGYGKTVLLADWVRRGPRPAAWLSLDAGDNDPARFWRHAVAALDQARPGVADRVELLLGPPAAPSFAGLLTTLINELAAAGEMVLVFDDYHLIDSQAVHASLGFLAEHRPPGLCLVLASRADPPLALARLRGGGQLAELRTAELRFRPQEAAELLQHGVRGADVALPDSAVAALAARTEGWAAGLQLAALSLRGQPDAAGFVAAFTGSHRFVLDFLAEEVLERQSGSVRRFLLETSVLERLSGPLCDAVTGRPGSQELLEQVERDGLFLLPLDEVRGWWRYHQLFADLLRVRLQAERPGLDVQLHRNAAAWYEAHELADDAIRHAVAARETDWAARLVERHFDTVYRLRGEMATIQQWFSALPASLVRSRPRLLLAQAQLAAAAGRVKMVERSVDAAERASAGQADDQQFEPAAGPGTSLMVNVHAQIALHRSYIAMVRGDAEATAVFASRALAASGEDERLLQYVARCNLGVAEWLRGRLAEAERAMETSIDSIAGWTGQPTITAWGRHLLSQVRRGRGNLDAAVRTCRQALDAASADQSLPAVGPAYVGLGEVAYQRNELDDALAHVSQGITLCRRFTYTAPLAAGLTALAWIRQATGDPAGALDAMNEAARAAPGPAGLLNPVPAQRAHLRLAQGDVADAARWTEERGLGVDDETPYRREPEYLLLARVLLAQGHPSRALALLDRLHTAAVADGRDGSIIEVGALRALALAAGGQDTAAVAALADVLILACPQGYVRIFADEGPAMAALLGQLLAARRPGSGFQAEVSFGCLARLQHAFASLPATPVSGQPPVPAGSGLVEPLTARELQVLALLAAGRSNLAIAGELFITIDTVKKHVSHLLGKLGTANRTEAVARARDLGLIP
jgi:LuxR family maltose regulon positive regulatory protein